MRDITAYLIFYLLGTSGCMIVIIVFHLIALWYAGKLP